MMTWIDSLKRWLGWTKVPPPTAPRTQVLFVLQANSPRSFPELSMDTKIPEDILSATVFDLEAEGRIIGMWMGPESARKKVYWINRRQGCWKWD
jgi:hypothetical protein